MKTVETDARSWDDLIFENRNHAYGAYAVRKAYPSNVNRAAAVTFGLAAAIAALSFIQRDHIIVTPVPPDAPPFKMGEEVKVIPDLKPPQPAQIQRTRGSLPPVATANPVEELVTSVETTPYQSGIETGSELDFVNEALTGGTIEEAVEIPAVIEDKVWIHTEVAAKYKGGMEAMIKFMSKSVKYPAISRRLGNQGTVYVSFVVGKSGEILDASVIKGIDAPCDAEALRVINLMKDWSPGLQGGVPVKVRMVLPITFRLSN
ncbi:MAG TPA: TonB family protein [Chryseolinea sp.]|nr:TonB family protein [Chryseolinea sp.]